MFNLLNYEQHRAFQICVVFAATLGLQKWFYYAHAGWIGFFVMMIYVGFEPGASIQRTFARFLGTMYGLLLSFILWFITQWDGNLLMVTVALVLFCAIFFTGKDYSIPTIFTVTLTALGSEYYSTAQYAVDNFFFDYFRSALIALFICVFFEYIVFGKSYLSEKFYEKLQKDLLSLLHQLCLVAATRPIKYNKILKLSLQCDTKALALKKFIETVQYDFKAKHAHHKIFTTKAYSFDYDSVTYHPLEATQAFDAQIETLYFDIHQLTFVEPSHIEPLAQKIYDTLAHLEGLNQALVHTFKIKKTRGRM